MKDRPKDMGDGAFTFLTRTIIVARLALLFSGGIVIAAIAKRGRQIESIHGQLNERNTTLMQAVGGAPGAEREWNDKLDRTVTSIK